ncbi:MAG TPA: phosphomannomutase/phosphoglucomutase [Planctomycetes bacterium]|nr:phosphomannomutase/phosphoglucomutase [Planctomycetota bacterium]
MGIFKAYDIRGLVPSELDAELARKIGYHFAKLLNARRLVVGQDMRTHSPELADAVSEGMRDAGADVVRLGLASTPMTYFSIGTIECDGGLCVTASHNPGEYNGMKLCRAGARPVSRDTGIAELETMCAGPYPGPGEKRGREESANMLDAYAAHVAGFATIERELEVVVDASNGMAGHTLPAVLERLPNVKVKRLFFELDGTFPNHEANPLKEENLAFTQEAVRAEGADFGVCLDGDADRCCFVDETGRTVGADLMTALFAPVFLERFPGTGIIYDLRSSWVVQEEVRKAGGTPVRERVGHSFMKATMREQGIQFGGELSGHFYFGENFVSDSGEIAFVTALGYMGSSRPMGQPLSKLIEPLRRYHSTGEVNFRVEDKDAMIASLEERYAEGKVDHLDGITVEFGTVDDPEWWWFNVRASNTEPLLRLNLEASSEELMNERRAELVAMLGDPV